MHCDKLVNTFNEHIQHVHQDTEEGRCLAEVKGSPKKIILKSKITGPIRKKWNAIKKLAY